MQSTRLSLPSILTALDLDEACLPLLMQAPALKSLMHAHSPDAVYTAIHTIGDILQAPQKAEQLVADLDERINIIIHKLKFITDETKPRVCYLADVSPAQPICNTYLEHITPVAGGLPIGTSTAADTADVIIIISGKTMPQLLAALPELLTAPEWAQAAAVKNGNVYIIHHPDHLRAPGALIADDIEILAEIFYPALFAFGRNEDTWLQFEGA